MCGEADVENMTESLKGSTEKESQNLHKLVRYCESAICAQGDCGKANQDCMEHIAGLGDPKLRPIAERDLLAVEQREYREYTK